MALKWLSIFVITTIFVSAEMASVEIISTPTKVAVNKPKPLAPDMKLGRANWESTTEKAKVENTTKLITDNKLSNNTVTKKKSLNHPEVKDWPSVFVLQPHPTHPVVCYAGKSLNIHKNNNNDLDISSIKEASSNDTKSSARDSKKFVLSTDPEFPVMCQEMNIPSLSMDNVTAEEENATVPNVTCIRRDYEHNISAIFINQVGPIQSAWNIFNSTLPYNFFNVENAESIGEITMLNDTIVDCGDYGYVTGDKGLSPGAIAALLGG